MTGGRRQHENVKYEEPTRGQLVRGYRRPELPRSVIWTSLDGALCEVHGEVQRAASGAAHQDQRLKPQRGRAGWRDQRHVEPSDCIVSVIGRKSGWQNQLSRKPRQIV